MNVKIKHWAFIIISFVLLLANMIYKEGTATFEQVLSMINYGWFVAALLSLLGFLLLDGLMLYLVRSSFQKTVSYRASLYCSLGCAFWGAITPLQSGNLASGIYIMSNDGVSSGEASTILIAKNIILMISSLILYLTLIILRLNYFKLTATLTFIIYLGLASLLIFVAFLVLASIASELIIKIANSVINLLYRIKVVKNKEKTQEQAKNEIYKMKDNVLNLKTKLTKRQVSILILIGILEMICMQQVLFFIYRSFSFDYNNYLTLLAGQSFCSLIMGVIPIPGGMGVVDTAFQHIMLKLFSEDYISYALFLWRLFSYYLLIFIALFGLGILKKYKSNSINKSLKN